MKVIFRVGLAAFVFGLLSTLSPKIVQADCQSYGTCTTCSSDEGDGTCTWKSWVSWCYGGSYDTWIRDLKCAGNIDEPPPVE